MTQTTGSEISPLPLIIAGPVLRRCTTEQVAIWLVTSTACDVELHVSFDSAVSLQPIISDAQVPNLEGGELEDGAAKHKEVFRDDVIRVGQRCFVHWLLWQPEEALPQNIPIYYDLKLLTSPHGDEPFTWLSQEIPDICYQGAATPNFILDLTVKKMMHGSCRKPHYNSRDALVELDNQLVKDPQSRPNFLMMTGDQIYADDVAGPTLHAIHQVISQLGLYDEKFSSKGHKNLSNQIVDLEDSQTLYAHPQGFYQRDRLLPCHTEKTLLSPLWQWLGMNQKSPIFTSVHSTNHLVTFAEVMAMYLLVWSPSLWRSVELDKADLSDVFQAQYKKEKAVIEDFISGLGQVRRVMAHLPTYMIFDDHDVTDDWNLTRGWEQACYSNSFSKQIIGNTLLAYLLCQGWGNNPNVFIPWLTTLHNTFVDGELKAHNAVVDELLQCDTWDYQLPTDPPTVVLDTRTQRWRSESSLNKPSGLMDWESLCELQQKLLRKESVIMVSPAPIYGVKFIEVIQKIFTLCGKPLTVDAENWMAHKGTASVILNIFRHHKTPPLFIILSGDVHYSFVYDVSLRFSRSSPRICQITASGIKNEFPHSLLILLDKLNRRLYHRLSPLNWLTRRRYMSIKPRKPPGDKGRTLFNKSGIGVLELGDFQTDDGIEREVKASILTADGDTAEFH